MLITKRIKHVIILTIFYIFEKIKKTQTTEKELVLVLYGKLKTFELDRFLWKLIFTINNTI